MFRLPRFVALLLGLACCAGALAQRANPSDNYVGRKFWYEPEHEKFAKTEFHRVPNFDTGIFYIQKKTKFEVLGAGKGWLKLRIESSAFSNNTAYIPVRMFRLRLYLPRITQSIPEMFRKASIFEEDPAAIQKRLDLAAHPAGKAAAAPPPWKIRNRGFPPPGSQPPAKQAPAETTPQE